MKKGLLQGIKVLDFSQVLSAPFCGMMLSDLGADVVKVERPGLGDISREYGPYINDISLYFCQYNRGKKGIAIDMRSPEGKKVVLDLAAQADVVIENFKAGTLEKLGIGYDERQQGESEADLRFYFRFRHLWPPVSPALHGHHRRREKRPGGPERSGRGRPHQARFLPVRHLGGPAAAARPFHGPAAPSAHR